MDKKTLKYYLDNSLSTINRYNTVTAGISKYFMSSFLTKSKVVDIGFGSGRDINILREMKFDTFGIDPCENFVNFIKDNSKIDNDKIILDSLPKLKTIDDNSFEGVLCSAVFMHIPKEELFDASFAIRRILKENGRLLISIPLSDDTIDNKTNRDVKGRLFNGITSENLQLIFERIGFRLINRWTDNDGLNRDYRKWSTMLFSLENNSGSRAIDTIESVLNKDRKVATYKLALFRALSEIAITNYKLALWKISGDVIIPVKNIAEKWIEYYWPIFESNKFIPQIQAESESGKPVAFRELLTELIHKTKFTGGKSGLSTYTINSRSKLLKKDIELLHKGVLQKIINTIKNGPIKHSGGSGLTSVFGYEKGYIIIPSTIWKELSLMGSWIQDATILRWASLTSHLSKGVVKPSEVIDCLLTTPIPERDVYSARSFYDSLNTKECVWTGKTITDKYDVDHAIPFVLWKNNDLWNLFPSDSKVNSNKKDKLPTSFIINKRKDIIVYYWEQIKNKYPARFEYEAEKFGGIGFFNNIQNNWQNSLFSSFTEAVEITAIQRGIQRWQPNSFKATGTDGIIYQSSLPNNIEIEKENTKKIRIPYYPDLKIACGTFKDGYSDYTENFIEIDLEFKNLNPKICFVIQAVGDSMDGGRTPIYDGDYLLFEINEGGTISNQLFAIELQDEFGDTSYIFKRIEKDIMTKEYKLVSFNKDYDDIFVDKEKMFPFARFKFKVERD